MRHEVRVSGAVLAVATSMAIGAAACAGRTVSPLSLRDTRLPLEARRWLADSEDEIAIALARLADARNGRDQLAHHLNPNVRRVQAHWPASKAEGAAAARAYAAYASQRLAQAAEEVGCASAAVELAKSRLELARAETAIKFDLAVYDTQELLRAVMQAREATAEQERRLEAAREASERAFGVLWTEYGKFVAGGGVTDSLWQGNRAQAPAGEPR